MSGYNIYKRTPKRAKFSDAMEEKQGRKEQRCWVPGTPQTKNVYVKKRSRKKLATQEKDFDSLFGSSFAMSSSYEKNVLFTQQEIDSDKPSVTCVTMISADEENVQFGSCVALTGYEKGQNSDRTESACLDSAPIIDLNMSLDSLGTINFNARKEEGQDCAPGWIDLNASMKKEHSSDKTRGSSLGSADSTGTSKEKEQSFDGVERTFSGSPGLIDLNISIYSLEEVDGSKEQVMQTHEGESTCLVSGGVIEGLGILGSGESNEGLSHCDSVLSHNPFKEFLSFPEPKTSQASVYADAISQTASTDRKIENSPVMKEPDSEKLSSNRNFVQDDGLMQENVTCEQIDAKDCIDSKKTQHKPKRKKHRPKVVIDGEPTKPKPATPKQAREKKPKLATPKQTKEKKPRVSAPKQVKETKSENVGKRRSSSLKDVIIEGTALNQLETKNQSDIQSNLIIEINETKAPIARALDFQSESLDAKHVGSASLNKKRRSKRRRKLNLFSFTFMGETKKGKKSKKRLLTVNWCPRKRRLQMKRPQKVPERNTLLSDKLEVPEVDAKIDLSFIDKQRVIETDTNHGLQTHNAGFAEFPVHHNTIVTNMSDDDLVSDKTDLSTMGEMEVSALMERLMGAPTLGTQMETPALTERSQKTETPKEFDNSTCKSKGEGSTSEAQKSTGKRKPKESTPDVTTKSKGRKGVLSKKDVNLIIQKLQSLRISDEGTLVPYQGTKKKKSSKVDLDSETLRVWNLLMNIDDGGSEKEASEETEKWWAKEREIFFGYVSSFNARMYQIQGDRGFRKWNGSVLDSAVGVFLTQNVSDHLSSNAFMSLAAKFPPQPTCQKRACDEVLEILRIQESVGRSIAAEYDAVGNKYFVSEPEPERKMELGRGTETLVGGVEETSSTEIEDITSVCMPNSLETSSGYGGSPQIKNTNLPEESRYNPNMILSCKKKPENECNEMKHGNETSSSKRSANLKGCCGHISPSCSQDSLDMSLPTSNLKVDHPEISEDLEVHNEAKRCTPLAPKEEAEAEVGEVSHARHCFQEEMVRFQSQKTPVDAPVFPIDKAEQTQKTTMQHDDAPTISKKRGRGKSPKKDESTSRGKNKNSKKAEDNFDWDSLRIKYSTGPRSSDQMDSVDWEAVRLADIEDVADAIKVRGQHRVIAGKIQKFLNRVVKLHECLDLEWLRNVPPDLAKEYLLKVDGLGLKSVECVRLLTLENVAFPVDTNVGRIAVRLGWVPLQPLPEELQIHLLEQYPIMDSIQKYLWPRLCTLDQKTLYELHYQMITFGKVFCTKKNPNCNACPMRADCRHFASAFASSRLALPGPSDKMNVSPSVPDGSTAIFDHLPLVSSSEATPFHCSRPQIEICEPDIQETIELLPKLESPQSEELEVEYDSEGIPIIRLNLENFRTSLCSYVDNSNTVFEDGESSKAIIALTPEAASIPAPKLKYVSRLRTEHLVYELPRNHFLLEQLEQTESDEEVQYHLAIWRPGETEDSLVPSRKTCNSMEFELCNDQTCFSCNNTREQNANIVRATLLIPCRVAMRRSFPLNGTYFQVNEVFADHETSLRPVNISRDLIYNLRTRTAYFGSSATAIFRGLSMEEIQKCCWKGVICVRGFERSTRAPRPLVRRFHCSPSNMEKVKRETREDGMSNKGGKRKAKEKRHIIDDRN
ncbi:protein ROS1-like isoform X1 [Herrania umbratica]|uniref:Protein ROS1-like isoform X1 n=1 Tax=Herrania umbratica TaxID=108875 RepID=A0A6J0ZVM4_9ROSI|nr:protein ROS1-like isoform X1 [Herrania umbratica]XP_021278783.1 protein ROS1-like isoform X1 [Herrania umbratica]